MRRVAYRTEDLNGRATLAQTGMQLLPGDRVLVAAVVDGRPGPHQGIAERILRSGRVRVLVRFGTRTYRVITDAALIYPLYGG